MSNIKDLPEILPPPTHDQAYVWLLMKGDSYLPGIIVSVYSVWRTNPIADLVVMVTPDVSEQAITCIKRIATHIARVPYLTYNTARMKTDRQERIYSQWINSSYTKWNMLALPYKKAVFIDADIVCLRNSDELFDMTAPAAPFNSPFTKPLGELVNVFPNGNYLPHNAVLTPDDIHRMLYSNSLTLTATSVLLEPTLADYQAYLAMMAPYKDAPYGTDFVCHSAPDERSISEYYIKKRMPWRNIHQSYNYIAWKNGFLPKGVVPTYIHYFSDVKPWNMPYNKYPDVVSWYKMAGEALHFTKLTAEEIKLTDDNIAKAKQSADTYIRSMSNGKVRTILDVIRSHK